MSGAAARTGVARKKRRSKYRKTGKVGFLKNKWGMRGECKYIEY